MLVVEHGGDTMVPRIGIMRALCRHEKPVPTPRKKPVKKISHRRLTRQSSAA
jgi:hypothetical protein